jgi:hypothetical protein
MLVLLCVSGMLPNVIHSIHLCISFKLGISQSRLSSGQIGKISYSLIIPNATNTVPIYLVPAVPSYIRVVGIQKTVPYVTRVLLRRRPPEAVMANIVEGMVKHTFATRQTRETIKVGARAIFIPAAGGLQVRPDIRSTPTGIFPYTVSDSVLAVHGSFEHHPFLIGGKVPARRADATCALLGGVLHHLFPLIKATVLGTTVGIVVITVFFHDAIIRLILVAVYHDTHVEVLL